MNDGSSIPFRLDDAVNAIQALLGENSGVITRRFFGANRAFAVLFVDGMSDKELINEAIIRPIGEADAAVCCSAEAISSHCITQCELKSLADINTLVDELLNGNAILLAEGFCVGLSAGVKKWDRRAVTESPTSTVIKGPREGFTEDFQMNLVLLRRKLRTPAFSMETLKLGRFSKTNVAVVFLKGVADETVVARVKARLEALDVDGILDSSYLVEALEDHKSSLFKQIGNTEKPDILAAKLLEGRVGVIVDGTPFALTVPYVLLEDFQSPEDYYTLSYKATFARFVRFISVLISVLMPGMFVAAQLYHLHLIPLRFLMTVIDSIKGIPLSPGLELFFTLLIFEILNEASVRMPKYVGMALSVVGALVLGDTAVRAGLVSTPTIMIMALSGIGMYTVPDQNGTLSVLRLVFLILAGSFGFLGILLGVMCLSFYALSLENYGTPLFAPFAPFHRGDMKDALVRKKLFTMTERPHSIPTGNRIRKRNP